MATPTYSQPLINESSPRNTTKTILFFLSIVGCLSLIACIGTLAIQPKFVHHLSHASTSSSRLSGQDLLGKVVENHAKDVSKVMNEINNEKTLLNGVNNHVENGPLRDCMELMRLSRDRLSQVLKTLVSKHESNPSDLNAWLSGILSNHFTCLNQLEQNGGVSESLRTSLDGLITRARVILEIQVKHSQSSESSESSSMFQKFLETIGMSSSTYPSWMSREDRKLLGGSRSSIKADVVVAKDGSGDFMTLSEAIKAAPSNAASKHVIRVKRGVYEENVLVPSGKPNLVIVGDGMDTTILTGDHYTILPNISTFNSYTLAIEADSVTLLDIGIKNTAGPEHFQAVALRVNADQVAVGRCKIEGYQSSLYTHTYRQFYKDSTIIGTIDFIFGYASVVLQSCQIIIRKPLPGQSNTIILPGRVDKNQFTAISLQRCTIIAGKDLAPVQDQYPSFLGRPWSNYSTAMVMQSYIGSAIDPKGWTKWYGDQFLDTLHFAEYDNYGPGSETGGRVDWPTYHVVTDPEEAMAFTVKELIQGKYWIDSSLVCFNEGL